MVLPISNEKDGAADDNLGELFSTPEEVRRPRQIIGI